MTPEQIARTYGETIRDLRRLQSSLQGQPEITRDVQDLIREMQRLGPERFAAGPELNQKIQNQILAGMEQVELQIRRQLEEKSGGSIRSGAAEPVPQGYAESVAEYFRRLSRGK